MVNLNQASRGLFSRSPDERFSSVEELYQHCKCQREGSTDHTIGFSQAIFLMYIVVGWP